jgi:hypothetical protein
MAFLPTTDRYKDAITRIDKDILDSGGYVFTSHLRTSDKDAGLL